MLRIIGGALVFVLVTVLILNWQPWEERAVDVGTAFENLPETDAVAQPEAGARPALESVRAEEVDAGAAVPEDRPQQKASARLSPEEAARERQRLERQAAAQARFDAAVDQDGLNADRIDPSVRRLFGTLTLEPLYPEGPQPAGFVSGMRIAELSASNALADAGFSVGDTLTRFNGQPLEDPAQIAHLVTTLDTRFEVCAQREDREFCRLLNLAAN